MSEPPYGISDYFKDLESLAQRDLSTADRELLKELQKSWEKLNSKTLKEKIENYPIIIDLVIEDLEASFGPIPFTCIPSWTGRTLKEKIAFYLKFPVKYQTLIVDFHMIDDEDMLKSHGILKEGDKLTVFLLNKDLVDMRNMSLYKRSNPPASPTSREGEQADEDQPGTSGLQTHTQNTSPRITYDSDSD